MIIDTMVLAYAMLNVPGFAEESIGVLKVVDEITAPASIEAELLNVVWQWGLRDGDPKIAVAAYHAASRLLNDLIPVETLWPTALELAFSSGHSPYDTLFVAAARLRHTKVVTYDKKLLTLFPNDTLTAGKLIKSH